MSQVPSRLPHTMAVLIACVVAVALPAPAQETEHTKILSTLPLGPESDTFHFSLTNTNPNVEWCRQAVRDAHGYGNVSTAEYVYATNDAADPCRASQAGNNRPHNQGITNTGTSIFSIHIMPVAKELLLEEGANIKGTLIMYSTFVGTLRPTVELFDRVGTVGTAWSADAADTKTDGLTGVSSDQSGRQWHTFAFDLGPAPKNATGALVLNVTLANTVTEGEVRHASLGDWGIGFTGANAGNIEIPLVGAVFGDAMPDVEPVVCPDGTEVNNTTECPAEAPSGPDGNATTGPDNNTTADPQNVTRKEQKVEEGFLPGFGIVTAVAALGLVAAAARRRR